MSDFVLNLILDTIFSWMRILIALALSIVVAWTVGILAARRESAERILLPIFDVLQGVPVLGFLPVILVVFVAFLPPFLGVDLAVVFLIFSGLGWSMAFAVYQAVSAIPKDILEVAALEKMTLWRRITTLYIPAAWSKVAYNTSVFWSAAVFYLVSSEIFSLGSRSSKVSRGIGVDLADLSPLSSQSQWNEYLTALAVLIIALTLTRLFFLGEFSVWSEKFKLGDEPRPTRRDPLYKFYSWVDLEVRSKLVNRIPRSSVLQLIRARNFRFSSSLAHYVKLLAVGVGILLLVYVAWSFFVYLLNPGLSLNARVLGEDELAVLVALAYSFLRIWGVYGLAVLIGFPLGIIVALHSRLYLAGSPILQIVSSIPAPVFLPAAIFFLAALPSSGELTALLVIFLGMIWYIVFNVMEGVRSIPHEIWEVVALSRMKRSSLWRHILIPAALPSFVTGSITAVGGGWSVLIVAEYFQTVNGNVAITQVSTGIGKLLDLASTQGDYALMALSLISMTILIVVVDRLFWKRVYRIAIARFAYRR